MGHSCVRQGRPYLIGPRRYDTRTHGRLFNSDKEEDVGDDHAVAMGFKEVEPVDLLAGTHLMVFVGVRLQAHSPSPSGTTEPRTQLKPR